MPIAGLYMRLRILKCGPPADNNAISRGGGFAALPPLTREGFAPVKGGGHPFAHLTVSSRGVVNAWTLSETRCRLWFECSRA